ncbi:MAG: hypothetical protein PVG07_16150, partial [Acidobacteriota bacterium]
ALPPEERKERMKRMRRRIRRQDVFWWADRYLAAVFGKSLKHFRGEREYLPNIELDLEAETDLERDEDGPSPLGRR